MTHPRMRSLTATFTAAVLISLPACSMLVALGGSSNQYALTTNENIYGRGATGVATIRNISSSALTYNLCARRLEREENKYWLVAFEWPGARSACPALSRQLAPGDSVSTDFEVPTAVPIGTYRIVFTGLLGRDQRPVGPDQAGTPSFRVR